MLGTLLRRTPSFGNLVNPNAPLNRGLTAWWPGLMQNGGNIIQEATGKYNGTIYDNFSGANDKWSGNAPNGMKGRSLKTTNLWYAQCPLNTPASNHFTCTCCFKRVSTGTYQVMQSYRSNGVGAGYAINMLICGNGTDLGYMWENSSDEYTATTNMTTAANVWYFGGFVITPTAAYVYLMDLETGHWFTPYSNVKTHNAYSMSSSVVNWWLGRDSYGSGGSYLDGYMMDARVYAQRALTESEMFQLAEATRTGYQREANRSNTTTFIIPGEAVAATPAAVPAKLMGRKTRHWNLLTQNNPLNNGINFHYKVMPQTAGGYILQNIAQTGTSVARNHGQLLGSSITNMWAGPNGRPGGYGCIKTNAASTQYAWCGNIPGADGAGKCSFGLWMYRASTGDIAGTGFSGGPNTGGNMFSVVWYSNDTMYIIADDSSTSHSYGYVTLTGVGWHYVWCVFDGTQTGNANRLKLYVDGVLQTLTFDGAGIPSQIGSSCNPFTIGRDANDRYSTGMYDDCIVMPGVAVTQDFVRQRMYESMTGNHHVFNESQWTDMVPAGSGGGDTPPPASTYPAVPHNIMFGRRLEQGNLINKSHPLTRGLVAAYVPFSSRAGTTVNPAFLPDLIGKYHGFGTGSFGATTNSFKVGSKGGNNIYAAYTSASDNGFFILSLGGSSSPIASGAASIICIFSSRFNATGGDYQIAGLQSDGSTNDLVLFNSNNNPMFGVKNNAGTDVKITDSTTTMTTTGGTQYHIAGTIGSNGMELYTNGILKATDSNTERKTTTYSVAGVMGGYLGLSNFFQGFPWNIHGLFFYKRQLSSGEIKAHYDEFRAGMPSLLNRNRTWIPVSADVPNFDYIEGTSSMVFGYGSTLLGGGNILTGSADMLLSNGVNPLTGSGRLVGESEITFGYWTVLSGSGALSGVIPVSFTASAVPDGGGTTGTSNMSLSASGTTTSNAQITGIAPMVMNGNAALLGGGVLTGAAAMVFGVGNVLMFGIGALAGNSILQFTSSPILSGGGATAGQSSMLLGGSAALLGAGVLGGSSSLLFGGSGSLLGAGRLSGSSAIQFAGTPYMSGGGFIAGTIPMSFGEGNSTLKGAGALAGAAAVQFGSGLPILVGAGRLSGAAGVTIIPTATLLGDGRLTGNSVIQTTVSGTGFGAAEGALTGSADMSFSLTAMPFEYFIDVQAYMATTSLMLQAVEERVEP